MGIVDLALIFAYIEFDLTNVRYYSIWKLVFMQEEAIIDLLCNGDENTFKSIYDRYQKTVINICYRFVGSRDVAEDLTQDVFVEVFRSIKRCRRDSKLSTWIYRIATTKSIDYIRAQKSKKRFAFLTSITNDIDIKEKMPYSYDASPEKYVTDEETKQILYQAINTLPENQRIAFYIM